MTYLYIDRQGQSHWSDKPPAQTDIFQNPLVNLVEAELRDGWVHITRCAVPLSSRKRLSASVFLRDFTPEKVRAACVAASKAFVMSMLHPEDRMSLSGVETTLEAGQHFSNVALRELTQEGEIRVYAHPTTGQLWVQRNLFPVANQCITPNGRTDGHMSYVNGGHGTMTCAFCGKTGQAPSSAP